MGGMERMRGKFITFEGGDGVGKSTQARRLAEALRSDGVSVTLTREPGGSPFAERLRTALLSDHGARLTPSEQAMMFAAGRADHVATVIAPALDAGSVVICDRFTDSTEAYQGTAGATAGLLGALRRFATDGTQPDLTVILDAPPALGAARVMARAVSDPVERDMNDPFERDAASVRERRRAAFLAIAAREPERCVVLDASEPRDVVAGRVLQLIAERLGRTVERCPAGTTDNGAAA